MDHRIVHDNRSNHTCLITLEHFSLVTIIARSISLEIDVPFRKFPCIELQAGCSLSEQRELLAAAVTG